VIVEIFGCLRYVHYIKCTPVLCFVTCVNKILIIFEFVGEDSPKASDRYHRCRPVLQKIVAVCFLVNRVLKLQDP
jgi:hypothetical protein